MFRFQILKTVFVSILIFYTFSLSSQTQEYALSRQDSALVNKYLDKAKEHEKNTNLKEASRFFNDAAMIYWEHNHYDTAIDLFKKSLVYNKQLGNENGIAMINSNLALINTDKRNYTEALKYFEKTLAVRKSNNELIGIISAHINIAVVLNNLHKPNEAVNHLLEALDAAREMNDADQMKACYGMLSETYEKAGNVEKSLYYYDYYRSFHELVTNEKVKKSKKEYENERLRAELAESEKEKKELELLITDKKLKETESDLEVSELENDDLVKNLSRAELEYKFLENKTELDRIVAEEKDKKNNRIIVYSLSILVFIIVILIILFIYSRKIKHKNDVLSYKNTAINQQKEEIKAQSEELEKYNNRLFAANKSITDSINYAQLIQTSLMTKEKPLNDFVKDSFILFKPRDIVSGDFYWYAKVDDKVVIVVSDCTGHGVPGAFLSMLGSELLNQIIIYRKTLEPKKILEQMDDGVAEALSQDQTDNTDGMELALCLIDYKTNKLYFSGAHRPLLLVKNNVMQNIKGSRPPIGGHYRKMPSIKGLGYQVEEFDIEKDMSFYIFSDGFEDQYNNENKKKYSSKRLRNLIFENHKKSFEEQKQILDKSFNDWKGYTEQIDDVLVVGVKI